MAKTYLEELQNSLIQKKRNRDKDKIKLGEIIDKYLEKYPETSFIKVKLYIRLFRKKFDNVVPKTITPTILRDWLILIRKEHNFSIKTLSHMKPQLQVIFSYMKREGYIASNPWSKLIFKNRMDVLRRNKLSQEDMGLIFENLYYYSPYFLYRFIYIMYHTGMTKQELVNLKWEHFNYTQRSINIVNPKAGFVRSFLIKDHIAELLNGQPRRNEYLITNRLGRKIDPNNICRYLTRFRERYPSTPEFNMDMIRNAFCFHYLEQGGSINDLSVILGHSSRNQTVRLYGKLKKTTAANGENMAADYGIELMD